MLRRKCGFGAEIPNPKMSKTHREMAGKLTGKGQNRTGKATVPYRGASYFSMPISLWL
jgi:hypothetical protein